MKYADIRGGFFDGHVHVFAWRDNRGFIGNLIEHQTGAAYTHVGLVYAPISGPLAGRVCVLEAREVQNDGSGRGSVQLCAASRAIARAPCDWVRTKIKWTPAFELAAFAQFDKDYSYLSALAVGLGLAPPAGELCCSVYISGLLGLPLKGATPGALVANLLEGDAVLSHVEV